MAHRSIAPLMKTHPLTGKPIVPVGYVGGRAVWPVMGGSEPESEPTAPSDPPAQPDPDPQPGFPANTPLEQMNADQREAYWKHQAQGWEGRAKGNFSQLQQLGVKSADDLAEIKRKVERHDALEQELMSDKDKAIAQAKKDAETTTSAAYLPQLVSAKLETAAAYKGVSKESLNAALNFVDHAKFLNDAGEVDTDKVAAFVDGIAPDKGTTPTPKGPTLHRHGGAGAGTGSGAGTALTGREMYQARHNRTTS